jgi:hypothetical protein
MSILYPEVTMSGVIGGALFTTGQSTSPQTDPHDFDVLTPTALAGRRVLMFISHTGYVFYDVNAIIDAGWDHVGGIITEGLPGEHTSFSCSTEVYTRIATGGSQTIPVDVTYLGDVADGHGIYYQVVMLGGIETGLGSIGVTQGVEPQHGGDLDILASIAGPPYGLCVALMATTTPNWYPERNATPSTRLKRWSSFLDQQVLYEITEEQGLYTPNQGGVSGSILVHGALQNQVTLMGWQCSSYGELQFMQGFEGDPQVYGTAWMLLTFPAATPPTTGPCMQRIKGQTYHLKSGIGPPWDVRLDDWPPPRPDDYDAQFGDTPVQAAGASMGFTQMANQFGTPTFPVKQELMSVVTVQPAGAEPPQGSVGRELVMVINAVNRDQPDALFVIGTSGNGIVDLPLDESYWYNRQPIVAIPLTCLCPGLLRVPWSESYPDGGYLSFWISHPTGPASLGDLTGVGFYSCGSDAGGPRIRHLIDLPDPALPIYMVPFAADVHLGHRYTVTLPKIGPDGGRTVQARVITREYSDGDAFVSSALRFEGEAMTAQGPGFAGHNLPALASKGRQSALGTVRLATRLSTQIATQGQPLKVV